MAWEEHWRSTETQEKRKKTKENTPHKPRKHINRGRKNVQQRET